MIPLTVAAAALFAASFLVRPPQPFRFLALRTPVLVQEQDSAIEGRGVFVNRFYAFQGDFDEVSRRAAAELLPLGFAQVRDDRYYGWRAIQFEQPDKHRGGSVILFQDMEYKRDGSGADRRAVGWQAPGWVSVETSAVESRRLIDRVLSTARRFLGY